MKKGGIMAPKHPLRVTKFTIHLENLGDYGYGVKKYSDEASKDGRRSMPNKLLQKEASDRCRSYGGEIAKLNVREDLVLLNNFNPC